LPAAHGFSGTSPYIVVRLATPLRTRVLPLLAAAGCVTALALIDPLSAGMEDVVGRRRLLLGLQILLVFCLASLLNRLVRTLLWDGLLARRGGIRLPRLLLDIATVAIYAGALALVVGGILGQPLTGFWATSGALGLVTAFALRNMILDLFTGVAVNIDRPYTVGDWIRVHDRISATEVVGRVVEINWRTTRICTEENTLVVVPNSVLGQYLITNYWGAGGVTRFESEFCLDFAVPVERARRVLLAGVRNAMAQPGFASDHDPQVLIRSTDELGIHYVVRYWIKVWQDLSPSGARDLINTSVVHHLQQAGLEVAYPREDVYLGRASAHQLDVESFADRRQLLRRVELFKALQDPELDQLARAMQLRRIASGARLINEGDPGDSMYVLLEGLLEIHKVLAGQSRMLGQVVPGDFLGEISLLTGAARSASVLAVTESVAYEIRKEHLEMLLRQRPELAEVLGQAAAERQVRDAEGARAVARDSGTATATVAQQLVARIRFYFKGVMARDGRSADGLLAGEPPPRPLADVE